MSAPELQHAPVFYIHGVAVHAVRRTDTAAFVVPVSSPQSAPRIVSLRELHAEPAGR